MKRFIHKTLILLTLALVACVPSFVPVAVHAQAVSQETKNTACEAIGNAGGDCSTGEGGISSLIASIVNILSWVVGVAAVIMVLVGGFRYVTSAGDTNAISAAKNTILYAIIGLVIALLSQGLVRFVLNKTTSSAISPALFSQLQS
jgi:hypothetical protein